MTEDATLDHEGAPGMVAPNEGQEPATAITDGAADGAPPLEETGQDERPKSPRELAMESITANRMRDLEAETGTPIDADGADGKDGKEGNDGKDGDTPSESAPADRRFRVKVDGEEMDLSEAEVIKGYQKDQTASRRLEHAAAESKRVQEERAQLNAEREAFEQTRKSAPAARDDDTQATPLPGDEGAKEIYAALVSGDEDEAVAAIRKLTQGRQTEAIPTEKIAAQVRQQIEWDEANAGFARDYKDITADPLLRQIASNTLTETLQTSTSYAQAFREAGDRTRAWVRSHGGVLPQAEGGNTPADPGLADKQSRKERIDNPTAINARAAGKPQERAETPKDVIAEMRSARGLPA